MKMRAEQMGGEMEQVSSPGTGTTIRLTLRIKE
jgi:signal transduction histidine kinase